MRNLMAIFAVLFFISAFGQAPIDCKKIEKDFVKIQHCNHKLDRSVYASKFELTNAQYNLFLDDLKKSGNTTLYNSCLRDSLGWKRLGFGFNDPMEKHYGSHPAYYQYPVVCISYESALAYCSWLTAKYNEWGKGKYKDVVFRLPSKEEWMAAANCKPQAPYPWYGSFPYGEKGCYYCNIRCDTANWIEDGGFYPVEKSSYFPNKTGLYNIVGNVAEMLSEKGIAKGGSWYNFPEEVDVRKVQHYYSADPGIGVRLFMEASDPKSNKKNRVYSF